jgi:hypothetical protein
MIPGAESFLRGEVEAGVGHSQFNAKAQMNEIL